MIGNGITMIMVFNSYSLSGLSFGVTDLVKGAIILVVTVLARGKGEATV